MIRLVWKETGEEFILPTPDNKPCEIDTIKYTKEDIEWLKSKGLPVEKYIKNKIV